MSFDDFDDYDEDGVAVLSVTFMDYTPKAVLLGGLGGMVWVPRAFLYNFSPIGLSRGDTIEVAMPVWVAEEKELV